MDLVLVVLVCYASYTQRFEQISRDANVAKFAESLHAALSLDEIRGLVASLGFAAADVQQTSDRHWTWAARK